MVRTPVSPPRASQQTVKRKAKDKCDDAIAKKKHSPEAAHSHVVTHTSQDALTSQTYILRSDIHWRESQRLSTKSSPVLSLRSTPQMKNTLHRHQQKQQSVKYNAGAQTPTSTTSSESVRDCEPRPDTMLECNHNASPPKTSVVLPLQSFGSSTKSPSPSTPIPPFTTTLSAIKNPDVIIISDSESPCTPAIYPSPTHPPQTVAAVSTANYQTFPFQTPKSPARNLSQDAQYSGSDSDDSIRYAPSHSKFDFWELARLQNATTHIKQVSQLIQFLHRQNIKPKQPLPDSRLHWERRARIAELMLGLQHIQHSLNALFHSQMHSTS